MRLRFTKENMYTGSGFVYDSLQTDLATFQAVAAKEFDANFVTDFFQKRDKIKTATGGALRTGAAAQTTIRLYESLDKVKPLLDLLDIRLGLIPKKDLTVAPSKFGLKTLRDRLAARDAEASSRALTALEQAIADNFDVLEDKGYNTTEQEQLVALHGLIDTDNAQQNKDENTNTGATLIEDADYKALDTVLGKVMRVGRLLHKKVKQKRQQYEATAILKRMHAGEQPQPAVAPTTA